MTPLLRIEGLDLRLPSAILQRDINFNIEKGDLVFLRGANGSGKSTFFKELFAVLGKSKKSPAIQVSGVDSFAFLPQSLNREFFIPLSLGEVAGLGGFGIYSQEITNILLPGLIAKRMWNVASGGEKQRALLAQTLSIQHSLYLLDEPFNHLDQVSVGLVSKAITDRAKKGESFLIATHSIPSHFVDSNLKSVNFVTKNYSQNGNADVTR